MFFACGIWCLADVSSVGPSSEQTYMIHTYKCMFVYTSGFSPALTVCSLYLPNILLHQLWPAGKNNTKISQPFLFSLFTA